MLPKVCRLLTFIFTIYFLLLLLHLDPLRVSQHGALSAVMCIFTAVLKKMCTCWISWMDLRMDSVDLVRKVSDLVKWLWSVCLNSLNTKRRLPGEVKAQSGSSGFCSRGRCCSVCVQHSRRCCRFFRRHLCSPTTKVHRAEITCKTQESSAVCLHHVILLLWHFSSYLGGCSDDWSEVETGCKTIWIWIWDWRLFL